MADHVVVVADRLDQGHVEELAARLGPSAAPSDPGLALAAHEQPAPVRRIGAPLLRPRHLDGSIPKSRLTRTCAHWRCLPPSRRIRSDPYCFGYPPGEICAELDMCREGHPAQRASSR